MKNITNLFFVITIFLIGCTEFETEVENNEIDNEAVIKNSSKTHILRVTIKHTKIWGVDNKIISSETFCEYLGPGMEIKKALKNEDFRQDKNKYWLVYNKYEIVGETNIKKYGNMEFSNE